MLPCGKRWTRSKRPFVRLLTDHACQLVEDLVVVVRVGAFLHDLRDRLLE
jgi:hypothetical protein